MLHEVDQSINWRWNRQWHLNLELLDIWSDRWNESDIVYTIQSHGPRVALSRLSVDSVDCHSRLNAICYTSLHHIRILSRPIALTRARSNDPRAHNTWLTVEHSGAHSFTFNSIISFSKLLFFNSNVFQISSFTHDSPSRSPTIQIHISVAPRSLCSALCLLRVSISILLTLIVSNPEKNDC